MAYQLRCPAGLKYNERLAVCDFPENVTCFSNDKDGDDDFS